MKIVVLDGYTENPGDLSWGPLEVLGDLTVYDRTADSQEAVSRIGDAELVLTNKTPIGPAILDACPAIRYIGVLATGYNVVDTAACRERNIPVTNIPAYGTDAVAQFTFALLLELCSQVKHHSDAVHEGRWSAYPDFCFWDHPLTELAGKTMGIIGFGRIGQAVGRMAKAFGMEVLAYSRSQREEAKFMADYVDLPTLLARSHVVSLHCPLFPENQGLICWETIAQMRDGAMLLNTARGGLVAEEDLAQALNDGKLSGAAVDVVSREPIDPANPLLTAKNCIITPHIAWAPRESRQRIMDCAAKNVKAFLEGQTVNVVN